MVASLAVPPSRPQAWSAFREANAPRYTSYPTAAQFHGGIDGDVQSSWLRAVPATEALSLYVHVPFCRRLCWYCGCNMRAVRADKPVSDYVDMLLQEIALVRQDLSTPRRVNHLHLGGGSPNTLQPSDLERLFDAVRRAFVLEDGAEIAAEIDPGHVAAGWIAAAGALGLTRASLGVQTFSAKVQGAINRRQTFAEVAGVVEALRAAGVAGVNFDLMYGLPEQTVADVVEAVDLSLSLAPDRLAIFGYAHVPQMKAHQRLFDPAALPGATARVAQMQAAEDRVLKGGYVKIGLDHYARCDDAMAVAKAKGRLRRNFQGYTTDQAACLVGFGASSISRLPGGFVQNAADVNTWRRAIEAGRLAGVRGVAVSPEDELRSSVIEGLMCAGAADVGALHEASGLPAGLLDASFERLQPFVAEGLVEASDGRVVVTEAGAPLVRIVCTAFDAYFDAAAGRHSRAV